MSKLNQLFQKYVVWEDFNITVIEESEIAFCIYKFFFNKDAIIFCNYGDNKGITWIPDNYSLNIDLYFEKMNPFIDYLTKILEEKLESKIEYSNCQLDPEQNNKKLEDFIDNGEFWDFAVESMQGVTGCNNVITISSMK